MREDDSSALRYDAAMRPTDTQFTGSIPELYATNLVPMFFDPYAQDLVARLADLSPEATILETAAGTGAVTRALAAKLPRAKIVATDLNDAMLAVAARAVPGVELQRADAQKLPFGEAAFDAVVCQFGFMFLPDKAAGAREARRVLRPGGRFVFNVWGPLGDNPASAVVDAAVARELPSDGAPAAHGTFMERIPFGWHDGAAIRAVLEGAGFQAITIDTVDRATPATVTIAAMGLCKGTPLRGEIEARAPGRLDELTAVAERALRDHYGAETFENAMRAVVVTARA